MKLRAELKRWLFWLPVVLMVMLLIAEWPFTSVGFVYVEL